MGVQFLNVGRLQTIKNDHNNDDQRCSAMFQKWIEKDTSASWKHLIKALRNIDMNQVAENISNAFYGTYTHLKLYSKQKHLGCKRFLAKRNCCMTKRT